MVRPQPRALAGGWNLLRSLWGLHPPVVLVVRASPVVCLQTLGVGARPSTDRLQLRNLFADGRRYYVQPLADGFRLTSDSRRPYGSRRRRTPVAAALFGRFSEAEGGAVTIIRLRTRMNALYLLNALFIPAFITSIILFMPWSRGVIVSLVVGMFTLSLAAHRLNAALQANAMVFFVQKVLEDLPAAELGQLPATNPEVVAPSPAQAGFREQWQKFYEEKSSEG
jgi:hypothetical protein